MTLYRGHVNDDLPAQSDKFANPYLNVERLPRNSPLILHKHFTSWFVSHYGVSFRSKGLFCTGNMTAARAYCDTFHSLIRLEPVGEYDLCYSPKCEDLYEHFKNNFLANYSDETKVFEELDRLEFIVTHNSGLLEAAKSGNEVMIVAREFFYERVL